MQVADKNKIVKAKIRFMFSPYEYIIGPTASKLPSESTANSCDDRPFARSLIIPPLRTFVGHVNVLPPAPSCTIRNAISDGPKVPLMKVELVTFPVNVSLNSSPLDASNTGVVENETSTTPVGIVPAIYPAVNAPEIVTLPCTFRPVIGACPVRN